MLPLAQCTNDDLTNYDSITDPIVDFIQREWVGGLEPKGYWEARMSLAQGITEQEIEAAVKAQLVDTCGVNNETDTQINWAEALTAHRVANEVDVFGSSPVDVLVKVVFRLGMQIADEQHKRKQKAGQ